MQSFGDRLYNIRKKRWLSQEALAEKVDVSRQIISKWELNSVQPTLDNIKALCVALDVSFDYFTAENDSPQKDEILEEVAADLTDSSDNPNDESSSEVTVTNTYNKKVKTFIFCSAIALTVFSAIALIISIVVGLTAFTPNYGDEVTTSIKFDSWSFIICFIATFLIFLIDIILWIKYILIKKRKM